MDFSPLMFAVAIPAVLFAAVSKGGFGGSAAFAASAILALVFEPAAALGMMLPLLLLMDAGSVRAYWGKWSWAHARPMLIGILPGVGLGALVWTVAPAEAMRVVIGVVALGFVAFRLAQSAGLLQLSTRPRRPAAGIFWGTVAGLTSFVSHAGGPPAAVYLLSLRLDKLTYQATNVLVFGAINVLKLLPFAALGLFTRDTLLASLALAPVALVGVALGVFLNRIVSERLFFGITYVLLVVTGARLIYAGLT